MYFCLVVMCRVGATTRGLRDYIWGVFLVLVDRLRRVSVRQKRPGQYSIRQRLDCSLFG